MRSVAVFIHRFVVIAYKIPSTHIVYKAIAVIVNAIVFFAVPTLTGMAPNA